MKYKAKKFAKCERKSFWASGIATSVKQGELEGTMSKSQPNSSISRSKKLQVFNWCLLFGEEGLDEVCWLLNISIKTVSVISLI